MEPDWEGASWFSTPRLMSNVTSAGGRLLAGDVERLYMLRPGEERTCELVMPGPVKAVAIDASASHRYAAATEFGQVIVFDGDERLELELPSKDDYADCLAWSPFEGKVALWAITAGGKVWVYDHAARTCTKLDMPAMHFARAADHGVLFVSNDGDAWWMDHQSDVGSAIQDLPVLGDIDDVAVADEAIAIASRREVWVRCSPSDEFLLCDELELPEYPTFSQLRCLAFEGRAADTSLFVGYNIGYKNKKTRVALIDAKGTVTEILEAGTEGPESVHLTAMTWDESRRALFTTWLGGPGLMFTRRKGSLKRMS